MLLPVSRHPAAVPLLYEGAAFRVSIQLTELRVRGVPLSPTPKIQVLGQVVPLWLLALARSPVVLRHVSPLHQLLSYSVSLRPHPIELVSLERDYLETFQQPAVLESDDPLCPRFVLLRFAEFVS